MSKPILSVILVLLLAASGSAGPAQSHDQPDTAFASNVAIDIVRHGNAIWLATSRGLNYSTDTGRTWLLYNNSNGLISNDVSAISSIGDRLWVATNHTVDFEGSPVSYSDGVSFTDDMGGTWQQVRFDLLTPPINQVFGGGGFRTIYDITGAHNRLFFAAFAGGFLSSADGGVTWRRLFASKADSVNFSDFYGGLTGTLNLRNEFFSCVADTSHGDSFFVWAGTAAGIMQFVFVVPEQKFYSRQVKALAISPDSNYLFVGGDTCISRGTRLGRQFVSRFGIQGDAVTAMTAIGGRLLMGVYSKYPVLPSPPFLVLSDDNGESFSVPTISPAPGFVYEFASVRSRVYCGAENGLYVSADSGSTWSHILVDSTNPAPANRRNVINGLSPLGDTLWVGTDSGLVVLRMDSVGVIASSSYHVFADSDTTGSRVIRVRTQSFGADSLIVWAVHRSGLSGGGIPSVSRWSSSFPAEWYPYQKNQFTNDVGFIGDSVLFLQNNGVRLTPNDLDPTTYMVIVDSIDNTVVVSENNPLYARDSVFCMQLYGDTLVFGTGRGIAISQDRGRTFRVYQAQVDSTVPDFVAQHTWSSTRHVLIGEPITNGLTGDFIPAMGITYIPDSAAHIFASCRPVDSSHYDGVSWGRVVLDTVNSVVIKTYRWDPIYEGNFAWNVETFRDTAFLPTDDGLVLLPDYTASAPLADTVAFLDSVNNILIEPGTPVYAARVSDSFLWVGTDDGMVRVNLLNPDDQRLYRVVDPADEVYAFPTPFSPQRGERLDFHFVLHANAYVTLEVYDFAMNLVARPIDNIFYVAGVYPGTGSQGRTWDGRNGRGDVAAVGVYYFKVIYSTGEVQWGKLAVMP